MTAAVFGFLLWVPDTLRGQKWLFVRLGWTLEWFFGVFPENSIID
jgi:hypothetical protein